MMKKTLNQIAMFCILFLGGLLTRYCVDHQQLYIAVIANTLLYVAGYCMGYCMGYKDNRNK